MVKARMPGLSPSLHRLRLVWGAGELRRSWGRVAFGKAELREWRGRGWR
jgi:hypothetical protein